MKPSRPWKIVLVLGTVAVLSNIAFIPRIMMEPTLQVMSYNIRYDNPQDGPNAWTHRKEKVANLVQFYQPDLIGLQEVLDGQLTYLEAQLKSYGRIGVGREDGKRKGEFSPIFYAQATLELLDSGTFWLSETPEQPSVGWDAALERIATWGMFRYRDSGDTLVFFNTHFDHRGQEARKESARLFRRKIDELSARYPVMATGDFNSTPQSVPYQELTRNQGLRDAYIVSELPHVGPDQSFSGFEVTDTLAGDRIDYVLVSSQLTVVRHAIITTFSDQHFPSDHLPVVAEVKW